jgi:hypothetical protein
MSHSSSQGNRATLSLMFLKNYQPPAFQRLRLVTWVCVLLLFFTGLRQVTFLPLRSDAFSSAQLQTTMHHPSSSTSTIQHNLLKETPLSSESSQPSKNMPPCCDDTVDCSLTSACCLYSSSQLTFKMPSSSPCYIISEVRFSSPILRIPYPPPKV